MSQPATLELTQQSLGSRILRGALSGLLINLLTNAFLFAGQLVIPRMLSRTEYAEFTVAISFVTLFALIADLGMTPMFTRMLAEAGADAEDGSADNRGVLFGSMIALRLGLAILVSLLVLLIAPTIYSTSLVDKMTILLITLFISSRLVVVRSVGDALLRSEGKFYVTAFFCLVDAIVFAGVLLYGLHDTYSLTGVVWIYTLCHVPGFLMLVTWIVRWVRREKLVLRVNGKVIWDVLKTAIPLSLATAFLTIHNEADKLLLDRLSNPMEVSSFGATMRLSAAVAPISLVIAAVTAPELTRLLKREDSVRAQRLVGLSLRLLITVAGAIALFLSATSQPITTLLLGDKYTNAGPLLGFVGWMIIPIFFATYMIEVSVAAGKLWLTTVYSCIIMITVIAGDLFLVGPYGAIGAMTAKITAVSLGGVALFVLQKHAPYFDKAALLRSFVRTGIALALFGILSAVLRNVGLNPFLIGSIVTLSFLATLHFAGLFEVREIVQLMKKVRS